MTTTATIPVQRAADPVGAVTEHLAHLAELLGLIVDDIADGVAGPAAAAAIGTNVDCVSATTVFAEVQTYDLSSGERLALLVDAAAAHVAALAVAR